MHPGAPLAREHRRWVQTACCPTRSPCRDSAAPPTAWCAASGHEPERVRRDVPAAGSDAADSRGDRDRAAPRHNLLDGLQHIETIPRPRLPSHPDLSAGEPHHHRRPLALSSGGEPVRHPEGMRLHFGEGLTAELRDTQPTRGAVAFGGRNLHDTFVAASDACARTFHDSRCATHNPLPSAVSRGPARSTTTLRTITRRRGQWSLGPGRTGARVRASRAGWTRHPAASAAARSLPDDPSRCAVALADRYRSAAEAERDQVESHGDVADQPKMPTRRPRSPVTLDRAAVPEGVPHAGALAAPAHACARQRRAPAGCPIQATLGTNAGVRRAYFSYAAPKRSRKARSSRPARRR